MAPGGVGCALQASLSTFPTTTTTTAKSNNNGSKSNPNGRKFQQRRLHLSEMETSAVREEEEEEKKDERPRGPGSTYWGRPPLALILPRVQQLQQPEKATHKKDDTSLCLFRCFMSMFHVRMCFLTSLGRSALNMRGHTQRPADRS